MKFLYFTDLHYRGTSPRARKDDFPKALEAKLAEIFELARRHQVAAILSGGDDTDRPDPNISVLLRLADVLKQAPVPIYTVAGNHSIFGYNPDTLSRSILGVLEAFEVIKVIRPGESVSFKDDVDVLITGYGFDATVDVDGHEYRTPAEPGVINIHIVHGMLLKEAAPYGKFTLVKDVQTEAHVILTGHDHHGYGLIRRPDGKIFCNPGGVARLTASAVDMKRQVRVALIDVQPNFIDVKMIPLESAKPGDEVLDRSHLDAAALKEEKMAEFLALLDGQDEARFMDIQDIITSVAKMEQLPKDVVNDALERISRAREAAK